MKIKDETTQEFSSRSTAKASTKGNSAVITTVAATTAKPK